MVRGVDVTMVHLPLFSFVSLKRRYSNGSVSGQQNTENEWVRTVTTHTAEVRWRGKHSRSRRCGRWSICGSVDSRGVVEAMHRNVPRLSVSFVTSNLWLRLIVSEEG